MGDDAHAGAEEQLKVWRLVVRGRRYIVLADDVQSARVEAKKLWPAVDFSQAVPIVHRDDNL